MIYWLIEYGFVGRAVDTILKKNTKIVDDKTTDDFTALHLAAVNDYVEIASALITRVSNTLYGGNVHPFYKS